MAAPPILLVADDLAIIASVKRVLGREGYECILATSAADAVIAWGHSLPGLVLLQPSVESDRGNVVLEELQAHPDAKLLRVVLLGETVPGFPWPVEPLPIEPAHFTTTLDENVRTGTHGDAHWAVIETATSEVPKVAPAPVEADAWRATAPKEVDETTVTAETEVPEPIALSESDEPEPRQPVSEALEDKLFGDLAADVERSAMQSVESKLEGRENDEELQRLEDDVRAEAQRRRESRQAQVVEVKAAPPTPPPLDLTPDESGASDDASFEDLSDGPPPTPSLAGEVLGKAEQLLVEARSQSEARHKADDAAERERAHQLENLTRRAEHAEDLVRTERESRAASEDELLSVKEEFGKLSALLENERELARVRQDNALESAASDADKSREELQTRHAQALDALQAQLKAETARRAEAEHSVEGLRKKLKTSEASLGDARAEFEVTLSRERDDAAQLKTQLAELELIASTATDEQAKRTALEDVVAERDLKIQELDAALASAREDAEVAMTLASEIDTERQKLEETRRQLEVSTKHLDEARAARDIAQSEMLSLEESREALQTQVTELTSQLESTRVDMSSTSSLLDETSRERDVMRSRVAALEPVQALSEKLAVELEAERTERQRAQAELNGLKAELEQTRTRAEKHEATAQLATDKVRELEAREVMSLALPGQRSVGVPRHGKVGLDGLAKVVCQLVLGNAEARLELGTEGGTRTLWFKRGQIIAGESTFDAETLIGRARRDGLIDARQDSELRMLKGATAREQLDALKARQFIRDIESVPLVQRYTEQVALDAFTEEDTQYRVLEEAPKPEVLLATVPRPTLPMLAESLRRAVAPDVMLEKLGGGEAVPLATDSELDLRALGFSERERKMLTWVDGEATVEDLSLASGLKPDVAFRALLVARLLGVIEVKPGEPKNEPSSGQLDVRRLEAKFDEVQDADYFTILGLSRAAGSDEVRRAFQRLAQEFDPLRFSGHPDASLQQRAQVVANLLEEAARALEDDRRRVEYARHLLD